MSTTETLPSVKWVVSASPHLRDRETTPRIMWSVVAVLAPAGVWSVYIFGAHALYVIALCVATSVITEEVVQRLRGRQSTIRDGSAVVTGLLLAYVLPSHSLILQSGPSGGDVVQLTFLKWQVPIIGSVVAIAVAKHCFGGLGHNIWNPALVGRAFVQIAFPQHVSLSAWPWPLGQTADAVTRATSLSKSAAYMSLKDLFFGFCPGSLGEVSAFLLLLGGVYLIVRRYVDWRLPLGYFVTLLLLATLFAWSPRQDMVGWMSDFANSFQGLRKGGGGSFLDIWLPFAGRQLFSGGVIVGAIFMATDMVTSPLSPRGQLVFGIGCGLLTAVIRFFSGYPEGVCYAILIMNTVRPYIDRYTRPKILGEGKE